MAVVEGPDPLLGQVLGNYRITGLLGAGTLLWAALQINPLVQTWLGAKLLLLLIY